MHSECVCGVDFQLISVLLSVSIVCMMKIISFHSVFMVSNSIRHGHLCLWFMMFLDWDFCVSVKRFQRKIRAKNSEREY